MKRPCLKIYCSHLELELIYRRARENELKPHIFVRRELGLPTTKSGKSFIPISSVPPSIEPQTQKLATRYRESDGFRCGRCLDLRLAGCPNCPMNQKK